MGMEILKVRLCRNLKDQSQIKSKTELETHLTDSSHLDPEAEREISPLIVDEGDHTPDNSNTDPEYLAADPLESEVAQFAAVLSEAQCVAVQMAKNEKRPKTYQGDSRTTQYHHNKARKALTSQGFPDIATFFPKRWETGHAVAGRSTQKRSLIFTEEEENSPGLDLESGVHRGNIGGAPTPSKALGLMPLTIAERLSQKRRLVFMEGEGDSPRMDLESGSNQSRYHSHGGVPSFTEALELMPLAVTRGLTWGQREKYVVIEEEEEEEEEEEAVE